MDMDEQRLRCERTSVQWRDGERSSSSSVHSQCNRVRKDGAGFREHSSCERRRTFARRRVRDTRLTFCLHNSLWQQQQSHAYCGQ